MKEKTWIDYRIEEMEEKAGAGDLPEFDMDGSRYTPHIDDFVNNEYDDAYFESISWRLGLVIGIVNPYEEGCPERLRRRVVSRG
jgi:hypothetical protein